MSESGNESVSERMIKSTNDELSTANVQSQLVFGKFMQSAGFMHFAFIYQVLQGIGNLLGAVC